MSVERLAAGDGPCFLFSFSFSAAAALLLLLLLLLPPLLPPLRRQRLQREERLAVGGAGVGGEDLQCYGRGGRRGGRWCASAAASRALREQASRRRQPPGGVPAQRTRAADCWWRRGRASRCEARATSSARCTRAVFTTCERAPFVRRTQRVWSSSRRPRRRRMRQEWPSRTLWICPRARAARGLCRRPEWPACCCPARPPRPPATRACRAALRRRRPRATRACACCPAAAPARPSRAEGARRAARIAAPAKIAKQLDAWRGCSGVRQCEPSLPARRSRGLTTPWKHACGRVADNIMRTKAPAPVGRLSIYSRCGRARSSPPELGLQAVVLPVLHLLALRQPLLDLLLLLVAPVLGRVRVGRVLEEVRLEVPIGELWKSGPRA